MKKYIHIGLFLCLITTTAQSAKHHHGKKNRYSSVGHRMRHHSQTYDHNAFALGRPILKAAPDRATCTILQSNKFTNPLIAGSIFALWTIATQYCISSYFATPATNTAEFKPTPSMHGLQNAMDDDFYTSSMTQWHACTAVIASFRRMTGL